MIARFAIVVVTLLAAVTAQAEVLSPEQMSRFEVEAAARAAQRKRATILSVVSRLDGAFGHDEQQQLLQQLVS